jgi:hypothetical protein
MKPNYRLRGRVKRTILAHLVEDERLLSVVYGEGHQAHTGIAVIQERYGLTGRNIRVLSRGLHFRGKVMVLLP